MNTTPDSDSQFHDNLSALGRHAAVPDAPSADVRSACLAELSNSSDARQTRGFRMIRKPALWSGIGLAACLALFAGLLFPANGGPEVKAATILARLNEQIATPQLIELTMDSITIEEVTIDGHLQVVESGVAGNLHIIVNEDGGDSVVEVDIALGLSSDESWVLLRKLQIPDKDAQQLISLFFPPGLETLLILPDTIDLGSLELDLAEAFKTVASQDVVGTIKELIENQDELGATVVERSDGTMLLTLPILDASSITGLVKMIARAAGENGTEIEAELNDNMPDDEDLGPLKGSTIQIVYDPEADAVQSFSIKDFGDGKGTISVAIREGEIDPDLLDSSRVAKPGTRTLNLGALEGIFDQLNLSLDLDD